ncbi:MAG: AMP-binding protein [Oscillospiraceae bacterium]|jgi:acetyl-CoA synthetase|nr:AMP-binding protein [Oscillospiraceae bacterium]
MEQVKGYYKKFVTEGFGEDGALNKFEINCPDNFNFAYDIIDKFGELEPDRPAVLWTDVKGGEKTVTYGELSRLSGQAANLLVKSGVEKGDKVMLVMKRNHQFWHAITALHKIGAVAIPATHLLTEHDFVYRFTQAQVKGIIATGDNPEIAARVNAADKETGGGLKFKFIVNADGAPPEHFFDFDALVGEQPCAFARAETRSREMMLLYFTSGTTGYPKMVTHDYRYALAHVLTAAHWQNVQPDGIHLTVADTGWAKSAWGKLYGQMALGACVFVYDFDKFVPSDVLRIIQDYKITSFCAPPTMFRFFIKEGVGNYDLSGLKYCTIAGEALNPEVFDRWKEYTGLELMEGFGQTESVVMVANLAGTRPKPGSMGKPVPLYNADIIDEKGEKVPAGEVGEIVIRCERGAAGMFGGYYKNDGLTDDAWHGGIYHTGDTAYRDEDGYYWYVGRNDDLIKASGYRIGPFEIESVLITHPAVLECAVTGAPDPIRGRVVKATVVLTKGREPSDALIKELQEHVKKNTAPYKYPRIVEFVPELPKTISGKIKRAQIREDDGGILDD